MSFSKDGLATYDFQYESLLLTLQTCLKIGWQWSRKNKFELVLCFTLGHIYGTIVFYNNTKINLFVQVIPLATY
jgi:hypothetical protein